MTTANSPGTLDDWSTLRLIAESHFRDLRESYPMWTESDLFAHFQISPTPFLRDIASVSGFSDPNFTVSDSHQGVRVMGLWRRGVWSLQVISEETGVSLDGVKALIAATGQGYGLDCYSYAPYGGKRAVSNGIISVTRRVSEIGQMSYRGHLYTLGASYRGRIANLFEREAFLIASFGDRPSLQLAARHYLGPAKVNATLKE